MKYVLVIGDGMADAKLAQLDGKTPLEALTLDAFDRAAGCEYGRVRTVPQGMAPGSDTAILSIFGNDPRQLLHGPQRFGGGRHGNCGAAGRDQP